MNDPVDGTPLVLLVTSTDCWELDEDVPELTSALTAAGIRNAPAIWDDPDVAWSDADLVVVRSTWDYPLRLKEFLEWADRVERVTRLANPSEILRWNTDKHYLRDLASVGVPTVPTGFLEVGATAEQIDETLGVHLAGSSEVVVKPVVSIGSRDTARFTRAESGHARELAEVILGGGRSVMVQPYLSSVDERGEKGLVYFDGDFSHAFVKGALLGPGGPVDRGLFALESISPGRATPAERSVGDMVIDRVVERFGSAPLYARIDLLATDDARVELLELEMTEPSWFLGADPAAAHNAVRAISARLR
ncbi:MAG: RimK family alpha-L-glutamate ligase [Microthrixaceae bacterium]